MKRREFLSGAALAPAALAAQAQPAKRVKITVLKRSVQTEFQKYRKDPIVACEKLKDGQEFIVESPWSKPEGMCDWAWADIRTFLHVVRSGDLQQFVTCCTDGFRPVFFRLERIV
jgi:uncharacterized repeat protein (TIGR04076 family)